MDAAPAQCRVGHDGLCHPVLRRAGADAAGGALGQRLSAPQTLDPAAVPVRMRAEVGACTLSLAELRGLAEGDVVFLDEHRVDGQGQLWMRLDTRWGLPARAGRKTGGGASLGEGHER